MTRNFKVFTLAPPTWIQRLWYWKLRVPTPVQVEPPSSSDWVRLLPQSWYWIHRRYAERHGLFWLPCIPCGRYSGGHQFEGAIPDRTGPRGRFIGICPQCTRAGRSWRVPHPLEAVIDAISEEHEHGHHKVQSDCVRCLAYQQAARTAFTEYRDEEGDE